MSPCEQLAVHYLDLDTFKTHQRHAGTSDGRRAAESVAERLCGCVREIDTVARLAADEFAVSRRLNDVSDGASLASESGMR